MLTDCSTHEETGTHVGDCHDTGGEAHVVEASSYLNPRMSRAQMLQTLGGGAALVVEQVEALEVGVVEAGDLGAEVGHALLRHVDAVRHQAQHGVNVLA